MRSAKKVNFDFHVVLQDVEMAAGGEGECLPLELDLGRFLADTRRSCSVQSAVPDWAKTEQCCMGIDEAGRGPVLGTRAVSIAPSPCLPRSPTPLPYLGSLSPRTNGVWNMLLFGG